MARILIVDELRTCSGELRWPLEVAGFEVISVTEYREATLALNRAGQPVDLVILNITGSPRKGLEWLRQTSAARLRLGLFPDGVLCVAPPFLDPQLELDFEYEGGKLVYEQQVRSGAA
ncbi:MAG: hypothetical protein L0338_04640 [Acidobacteria bacterium]|nr:hypothetical protein [Acidobacteriota bacterium]